MTLGRLAFCCLLLLPAAALAQADNPNFVLTLPKPGSASKAAATPAVPPKAAPVAPVQQTAPMAQAMPTPKPAAPPPLVTSKGDPHAHKTPEPAGAKHPPQKEQAAAKHPAETKPPADGKPPAEAEAKHPPPAPPPPAKPADIGSVTGLKLPRFVALRTDEVNMRVGPGTRFPVEWQYHRRDLPVQILREVEVWRLIADEDGVKGWVHQATLAGHRSFVVNTPGEAILRHDPDPASSAVARLQTGVVGRIRSCDAASAWCQVEAGGYRGWLRRTEFWGTFPDEAVGN